MSMFKNLLSVIDNKPYIELQYIKGNGSQYINTGLTVSANIKFEIEFELDYASQWACIMGIDKVNTTERLYFGMTDNYNVKKGFIYVGSSRIVPFNNSYGELNVKTLATYDGNKLELTNANGTSTITINSSSISGATYPMYIFSVNRIDYGVQTATGTSSMKLYRAKIYNGDALVCDMIPVLDKNNVACLYDKVTQQYFYNQGSGTFSYE